MIIKIISNIKIHLFFYVSAFICVFTGHFKDFALFTFIILFHELGHIIAGTYFKWDISKIIVLPFGAITIFNTSINKPFKEEFIVSIIGFIFQFILYLILGNFNINNLHILNFSIFLFNCLPIYPLDGFKILNCIINLFLPFKLSNLISIILSFLFLVPLLFYKNLIIYLTIFFLIVKVIDELKKRNFIFLKFLMERKNKNLKLKKFKIIKNINLDKMFKYYKNIFYSDKLYYTENEILNKKFDFYL